ncbi:MAG: hypothetical protein ACFFCW_11620 [Candidatus Hodarchaeota archaeon]
MPWNSEIEAEYDELIAGPMGSALDLDSPYTTLLLKNYIYELETGSAENLDVTPVSSSHLNGWERLQLHLMRAACSFFTERSGFFPWRVRNKPTEQLRPLLSSHYQGLRASGTDAMDHRFHHVWDVKPGQRMIEAVFAYLFMALAGQAPATEQDMIVRLIQSWRDAGWYHMSGYYDDYEGYFDHGGHVYDFETVAEVKRSGCHLMADFIVCVLRPFNIPAHYGRGWGVGGQPSDPTTYWQLMHTHGHCFVHFASVGWWLSHADDVYSALLRGIPPQFAMRSDYWMHRHQFDRSEYEWARGRTYEDNFWWCLLLGTSPWAQYDVRTLYYQGVLRERLETLHEIYDLAERDGAPDVVPPVFDESTVDFLMAWVTAKV